MSKLVFGLGAVLVAGGIFLVGYAHQGHVICRNSIVFGVGLLDKSVGKDCTKDSLAYHGGLALMALGALSVVGALVTMLRR